MSPTKKIKENIYDIIFLQNVAKGYFMKSVAIRDLKNNPSSMTKYLENNESVFITKHNKPIGVTIPLNDDALSIGVKRLLVLEQYKNGTISLGKLAELLAISKEEAMSLLNSLNIDFLDLSEDDLKDELEVARKIAK